MLLKNKEIKNKVKKMQFIGGWFYVGEEIMQIELYKVSESNNILIKFNGINLIFQCCFIFPLLNVVQDEFLFNH